jgi:hypothetical protein
VELDVTPWQTGGIAEIQAIDLYSAGGTDAYFDDIVVEQILTSEGRPRRDVTVTGECPDPDPIQVTVTAVLGDGDDPAEEIVVTEVISGGPAFDAITPQDGGVKTEILPRGFARNGFIDTWFVAANIVNPGGANPGQEAIRVDYLDDGGDINEVDYEPFHGDVIAPLAGVVIGNGFNPGAQKGELTVQVVQSNNGIVDFNVVNGDTNNVIAYMWTYINVAEDMEVDLCIGSDDSVQVFIDSEEVWINSVARGWGGGCQDLVFQNQTTGEQIFLEEGTHLICMKIFEGGGGHRGGMQIQAAGTDTPAEGITICGNLDCDEELPSIGTEIVWNVTRQQVSDGVGYGIDIDQGRARFRGNVDGNGTTGDNQANVCPPFVDPTGSFLASAFLVYGPFAPAAFTQLPCGGESDQLTANHISPVNILCFTPAEDEEYEFDPTQSVMERYIGPRGPEGDVLVRRYGGELPNLQTEVGGNDRMEWLITYVEYVGDEALDAEFCFNSDDGGVLVWDDQFLHVNNVCRGVGALCNQDLVPVTIEPGMHRIAMAAWNRGGGWGLRLTLRVDGVGVGPADPDWIFHGYERPDGFPELDCPTCDPTPVSELACQLVGAEGDMDLELSWVNPPGQDPNRPTVIQINGEEVGTTDTDATSFTVVAADLPEGNFTASVIHCGGVAASCTIFVGQELYINCGGAELVDADGRIWLEDTLASPSGFLTSPNTNTATNGLAPDTSFDEFSTDNNIDTSLFNSERWSNGPVEYTISGLDDAATYDVTLFFMEHCCSVGCLDGDPAADVCDTLGEDGELPFVDAQTVSSTCRVFDILINDVMVQDQFSKNAYAACLADVPAGAPAYGIGVSLTFAGLSPEDGSLRILLLDLGAGNPPENASIKALCLMKSDGPAVEICDNEVDDDGDGMVDCDDDDCADDPKACPRGGFVRGDSNSSGVVDLTDGVVTLNFLFIGGGAPVCMNAADTDNNGQLVISDAVITFSYLFTGGPAPQPPSPTSTNYASEDCGSDTDGDLGCETPADKCL